MENEKPSHIPTLKAYVWGFTLSIIITLISFGLAYLHVRYDHTAIPHQTLFIIIPLLALIQLTVQSIFFLHISLKPDARVNLVSYGFIVFMVLFLGIGSIWVLNSLNNNMSPEQMGAYLHNEN